MQTAKRKLAANFKASFNHEINHLISKEKDCLNTFIDSQNKRTAALKSLVEYGQKEDEDLKDLTNKLLEMHTRFLELVMDDYKQKYTFYRQQLKDIRQDNEDMDEIDKKKKNLESKLSDAEKKNKPLQELQNELMVVEKDLRDKKESNSLLKRDKLKQGLKQEYLAMAEYAAKMSIVAEYGLKMIDEVETIQPMRHSQSMQSSLQFTQKSSKLYADFCKDIQQCLVKQLQIPVNSGEQQVVYQVHPRSISQYSLATSVDSNPTDAFPSEFHYPSN